MTPEEKEEFERLTTLAIEENSTRAQSDQESELFQLMQKLPAFTRMVNAGTRELLFSSGIHHGKLAGTDKVTVTVQDVFTTVAVAMSVGMDIAETMRRYGVKFPTPKAN